MNSKRLGGSYERAVAEKLSFWLSGSKEELVCWRAPHSGSVGTNRKKKGLKEDNVSGDFQCLNLKYERFFKKCFVDSKSYKDINFMVINPKNQKSNSILNQWNKVCGDAGDSIPFMIVKIRDSKTPEMIFLPSYIIPSLDKLSYIDYFQDSNTFLNFKIYLLDEFLEKTNWETFLNLN